MEIATGIVQLFPGYGSFSGEVADVKTLWTVLFCHVKGLLFNALDVVRLSKVQDFEYICDNRHSE